MYDLFKLKALRRKEKYTIYDMAAFLDISPSFYCQIENKKRRLYYDTAVKIAAIFNMTPDEIFYVKSNSQ